MAGAQPAVLEAWAIPAQANRRVDHTYVLSSVGHVWKCWGRSAGGTMLRSANGDAQIADCLSQPDSEAGIRYAVTGVCHQTANRILYPAQLTVAGCNGWQLSVFAYRVYGIGPWPELQQCSPAGKVTTMGAGAGQNLNGLVSLDNYDRAVVQAHASLTNKESIRLAELSALVEATLGGPLDKRTFAALASIQDKLHQIRAALAAQLDAKTITPDEYVARLRAAFRQAMSDSERVLGRERFMAVFGAAGDYPDDLIDEQIFFANQREQSQQAPRSR